MFCYIIRVNGFLFLLSNTICTSTISSEYFVLVIEIFYSVRSFSTLVIGGGTHVSVFLPLPPTDALLPPAIFSLSSRFLPTPSRRPSLTWALPAAGPRTAGGARGPRHRVHLLKLVDCAHVARAHNFFVLMGNRYG